jgi:DNA-binding CsgD family transcriptional regulator
MTVDFCTKIVGASHAVAGRSRGSIVFWGSPIAFSEWILRVAEAESGAMEVRRVDSLDEIDLRSGPRSYVFFDDNNAELFLSGTNIGPAAMDGIRWILAYRDEVVARRMLRKRRESPELSNIGLLPMNLPIDIWTPMLRLVLSGDFVVPGSLLDHDAVQVRPEKPPECPKVALTPRENEVLSLVARGMRNKTIAHELGLSEHTIKLHLHHVIHKIGVRNRTQATQWYLTQSQGGGH